MKCKLLILAVLTALIGTDARAVISPQFNGPVGYLNTYGLSFSGARDGEALFGTAYTVADLQAVTTNDLDFELKPNILAYNDAVASGDTNEYIYWTSNDDGTIGSDGGKWVEANTYYELLIPPGTTNITFNYASSNNTLDARYQPFIPVGDPQAPIAFLKVFKADFSAPNYHQDLVELSVSPSGTLSYDVPVAAWGLPLQCGFQMQGINAASDIWGSIDVSFIDVIISSGDGTPPAPAPDFILGTPKPLSDSSIELTCSTSEDASGVEYMFENTNLNYNSGWITDTNWVDEGPIGPPTTNDVDVLEDPTYLVLDNSIWEGYADGGAKIPNTFVTSSAGVATVTPATASEYNFYQTFGVGTRPALTIGQAYEFTIVSDNSSLDAGTTEAVAFVKAFAGSGWSFLGDEFQTVALPMDGSPVTINFTPVAGDYYQVGTFTVGTTSGSYDLSSPSLFAADFVSPGEPLGLTPDTEYCYRVRARDMSTLTNDTGWSAVACTNTLAGDITAPTPNPMTFDGPGDGSPASVKMTATTATDASAVEYYFENVSGDGADSGWQSSPIYADTGLASSSNFEYRVRARDLSLVGNTNDWSVTNISITTLPYPLSVSLASDLKGFTEGTSNEDETVHDVLKANLQFTDYANLDKRVAFDANGATFGSFAAGDPGRNILKTLANDYASGDFEAYITVSWADSAQSSFIGFGPGDDGNFGVPDWSMVLGGNSNTSFIVELSENLKVWSQEASDSGNGDVPAYSNAVAIVSNTLQRIKLTYDAGAETCEVSVDLGYTGSFVADVTTGPIATPNFTGATTVYLGGDDGVVLSDFEIVGGSAPVVGVTDLVITSTGQLQWTSVLDQNYDVVYKNDLTAPTWTADGANQNIPGTGGIISTTPIIAGDEVFYQVIAE